MECLVKVYNKDAIKNLVSIFAFKPQKVIFLYDKERVSQEDLDNLKNACKTRINNIVFESIPIEFHNIDKIYRICKRVINRNPNCFFDITGTREISTIAMYLVCKKKFIPIFSIDMANKTLINIYGCNYLVNGFMLPKMSIESLFQFHGVSITGSNHPKPAADIYANILKFCEFIFKDIPKWKEVCFFLQTALGTISTEYKPMQFASKRHIKTSHANISLNDTSILYLAEQLGFLRNLYIDDENITFSFKNDITKKYMTDFGTWLELYVFIKIQQDPMFNDVRISTKINWNTHKQNINEITNEIDVTFFYGIRPVFISCKLSEPSSDALQELSVYSNYLGGKYSKCILVTLSTIKKDRAHIFVRAEDMNISIIDGRSIHDGTFIDKIKEALDIY